MTAFVRTFRGRPIADADVTFVITAGGGTMNPVHTTTDQNGEATSVLSCGGAGATTVSVLVEGAGIGGDPLGGPPSVIAGCP